MKLVNQSLFIIDPAVETPATDAFNRFSLLSQIPVSYHLPALYGMDTVYEHTKRSQIAGIVILGSAANVDENRPWQAPLIEWLKTFTHSSKDTIPPILGICYGHQLLAAMFGAKVDFHSPNQARRMGTHEILFSSKELSSIIGEKPRYYFTHRQAVLSIEGCPLVSIAQSSKFSCEAFKHEKKPIFGIQAHPEATPLFIKHLKQEIPQSEDYMLCGSDFLKMFLRLCNA